MIFEGQIFEGKWGKYEIGKRLGKGVYGWVHSAKHLQTGKDVAVKIFKPVGDERPMKNDLRMGFNDNLQSPYTINYIDNSKDPSGVYRGLIMDLMEGSLENVLKPHFKDQGVYNSPFTRKESLRIFGKIVLGIGVLHVNKFAHFNLKSENVLCKNMEIKLTDFASSREFTPQKARFLTEPGLLVYMSPEMVNDEKNRNLSSDIWSLGIIFHLLFEPIFPYNFGMPFLVQQQVLSGKVLPFLTDVPHYFLEVRDWMLNTDMRKRPTIFDVMRHPLLRHIISLNFLIIPDCLKDQFRDLPPLSPLPLGSSSWIEDEHKVVEHIEKERMELWDYEEEDRDEEDDGRKNNKVKKEKERKAKKDGKKKREDH